MEFYELYSIFNHFTFPFSVVYNTAGALGDDTENGCVADYIFRGFSVHVIVVKSPAGGQGLIFLAIVADDVPIIFLRLSAT